MLKHLRLCRPLVFVDVETTGVDPARDRVVQLGLLRLAPGEEPRRLSRLVRPDCPIPPAATAVHGIRDEHVASAPPFRRLAASLADFLADADLAGFNVRRFDLPFLAAEFARCGRELPLRGVRVVDALTVFHAREPRDLSAALRLFCKREPANAHDAAADAEASAAVLDAMLGRYKDLPRTVAELHAAFVEVDVGGWFSRDGGEVVFARGKHRGSRLADVARQDSGYLHWLTGQPLLPDARRILAHALRRDA